VGREIFPPLLTMRAFILGNSGELLDHDLNLLKGEVVFGSNALLLRCPEIITHCVLTDIAMAFLPQVRARLNSDCTKYYSRLVWNTIYQEENVKVFDVHPEHRLGFAFSDELVYPCGNVCYSMLQIAAALGFDEIYLLGIDLGLPANGIMSIPESDQLIAMIRSMNLASPTQDKRLKDPSHESLKSKYQKDYIFAKSELDKRGIKVFNLSRGGNLNCFPRTELKEVLNKEKLYVR
jgi:hypothetical protein